MKASLCILILIFSYSYSIYYSDEEFEEIKFMNPTYFSINKTKKANFRYNLTSTSEKIGLKFLRANLYTVNVTVCSSYSGNLNCIVYELAKNQFKEIDVNGFNYVDIVIEQLRKSYYYDDYLTIYDSGRSITLEDNKIIQINNFLSNNKYQFSYVFNSKNISLMFSTQNYENNKRKIYLTYNDYSDESENDTFKKIISLGVNETLNVTIENNQTEDNIYENQGFSLIIHEIQNSEYNFNEIPKNIVKNINYIYNNENQSYYFYTNISGLEKSNTFNIKLNYKYFKNINKNNFKVLSNYIGVNDTITQEKLENNIPTEEKFPASYDSDSDEYYRIYISNISNISETGNSYQYLLVKIEITDEKYFYGGRTLDISIGEQEKVVNYSNLKNDNLKKIEIETKNYIPYYEQLILNNNEIYLLIIKNEDKFISELINGDLMINDTTINNNYLDNDNEIMVLSDMDEATIKLFGRGKNNTFYIQSVNKTNLEYAQNTRNDNQIFELSMKQNEIKYILGTYSFSDYAYGGLKRNYYATIQNGEFKLFYKNNISNINEIENQNIFTSNDEQALEFDKLFTLSTNLDLFTIKCIQEGIMYIRPQYKKFNETTHLLEENGLDQIHMSDRSEIVQLSAPVAKNNDILYFSIIIVNSEALLTAINNEELTLEISPDTEGAFNNGTIKKNQVFKSSINLANFRTDQLAIHLKANDYGTDIEMVEVIHNNYTAYTEIKKGENKNINSINVNFPILNTYQTLFINIANLKGKNITYGIIKSPINDANYLTTADKYKNLINEKIEEDIQNIALNNKYYHQDDNSKPYIYFILSILDKENDLNYEITMDFKEDEKKSDNPTDKNPDDDDGDDNTTTIIIIVVIVVAVILLLGGVILFKVISKKRRANSNIENISAIESD